MTPISTLESPSIALGTAIPSAKRHRAVLRRRWSAASSIIALAAVAACGSGGGGDTADATAPVISLSVAATTVDGGETVPITVSATDARDGNVEYRLTCSAGTLTGNLLVTPVVAADAPIICTATAADRAGNASTQTLTITARASVATLVVPEGLAALSPGSIAVFQATNLPLTAATYSATIDGLPATLFRVGGNTLAVAIVADTTPGTKRLQTVIGNRTFVFSLVVGAPPTIADPRAVVQAAFTAARARVDVLLPLASAADRPALEQQRSQIDTGLANLATAPANDILAAARALIANRGTFDLISRAASAECLSATQRMYLEGGFVVVGIALAGSAGLLAGVFIPGGGALLVAAVTATVALKVSTVYNDFQAAVEAQGKACLLETAIEFGNQVNQKTAANANFVFAEALSTSPRQGFRNKQPGSVSFIRVLGLDDSLKAEFARQIALVKNAVAVWPFQLGKPGSLDATLITERREPIPASELSYAGSSNGSISGAASRTTSGLSITFTADDTVTQNTDFSFTVARTSGTPITVPAQLVVNLPTVEDAALTISQGVATRSSVTVRGADRLEIVQQPTKGSVALSNDGNFTYTPSALAFGEDRFTYRGINAEGRSRVATVLIAIIRRFEGAWTVTSRSTTTAESSPGLCPTENKVFTVNVAKVSDTQYSVLYKGSTISLTMASRDDPAGLSGSGTASYAQDGGTTTETLSINAPTSMAFTGTGTFRYVNPSASCSGTLSFTGWR